MTYLNSKDFLIKLTYEIGRVQASTRAPKLSFAHLEQSRTNQVVDQKIIISHTYSPCQDL